MLIKCPECELQISDKAVSCPHCGYPLKPNIIRERQSTKRKRLPNGFGQISKIKGKNLRKPFRAMVSVGKNPNTGRPIVKPLQPESYFHTYNEAYTALAEYNRNPYDLDKTKVTMSDLYEEWSEEYYKNIVKSSVDVHRVAWNKCSSLYDMKVSAVKTKQIRYFMDSLKDNSEKDKVKILLGLLFDYAVECEYTDKNYARDVKNRNTNSETTRREHIAFTQEELNKLWSNVNSMKYVDIILIQCYTGFRPQELVNIKLKDVDLKNDYITGGMKTEAGKNRIVPIHEKIKGLVKMKYEVAEHLGSEYLFNKPKISDPTDLVKMRLSYGRYRKLFNDAMSELNIIEHRCHDPRKTFVTLAKRYGMDEYALKRIVGHSITDVTESVYTERDLEWLKQEINKISV